MKKLKPTIIFIVSFLFLSCSKNKATSEFEQVLGKTNSITLSVLVENFENDFLLKQYPDLSVTESYKEFLIDYGKRKFKNKQFLSSKDSLAFINSDLEKEMYYHPDSVWILPNSTYDKVEEDSLLFIYTDKPYLKLRKKDLVSSSEEKIVYKYERHYGIIDNSETHQDSLINFVKNIRYTNYYDGRYRQALYHVEKYGGFFERFSERKGIISKLKMSELVLNEADLSNALVRKIIVLEFVL
ncbi:conserved exported hypothetical protein [Tenacibaculum sp. 190524A05c]|uniref:hypothetical protein n=1 Tax=Tenacibaculum platacis TaxID=3137852 RepID=UPI0031FAD980